MGSQSKLHSAPGVAALVAGEDLACGDYVALHTQTLDVPSYFWEGCGTGLAPGEMVRLKLIPNTAGEPLRVLAICLPYVYAQTHCGQTLPLDLRRMQLVRLDRQCAKTVWKQLRTQAKLAERKSRGIVS